MFKLFADYETYWSDDYTLRKVTPIEYIMDPRFEALGCAFVFEGGDLDGHREWVAGPNLPDFYGTIDWKNCFFVTHNALFDALILAFRYGRIPAVYGDTLAMARNWISHSTGSVSLDACSKFYGLAPKMLTVAKTKGVSYDMLTSMPDLHAELIAYAMDDCLKCQSIFRFMMDGGFPGQELETIDMVVRMAAQPMFELDQTVLYEHLADVQRQKQKLLDDAQMVSNENLRSDVKFAAMLTMAGVQPPMKLSPTTGKEVYAFAKSDKAFTALAEHDDPYVQALVAARLGHKSTIEETRTQRFIDVSRCSPRFPVPLKYSGAHTHRFSGDWRLNAQNLPRGGKLRKAMKAPKGTVVVSVDASQIEARFNATFAGEIDLIESFRANNDVYSEFAETIYKHPVNKKDHPDERFVGKTGILSLGYGSGPPVFQNMCRVQGGVHLSDGDAYMIVNLYRRKYGHIVENWYYADRVILPALASGTTREWGPLLISPNAITLPSGNKLRYRDLRHEYSAKKQKHEWMFTRGNMTVGVYGAKIVENVIQAMAFVHIMDTAKRVLRMTEGMLRPVHQVHDELIYIVEERLAEQVRDLVVKEMSRPPMWMPDAPLAAEGHMGVTYGDTK